MNEINTAELLSQMRLMAQKAGALTPQEIPNTNSSDFSSLLKTSIDKVNSVQKQAGEMATAYEMGSKEHTLPDVMIQLQKANLSFQAMTQVRNRLVSAYQDVMNMQI